MILNPVAILGVFLLGLASLFFGHMPPRRPPTPQPRE